MIHIQDKPISLSLVAQTAESAIFTLPLSTRRITLKLGNWSKGVGTVRIILDLEYDGVRQRIAIGQCSGVVDLASPYAYAMSVSPTVQVKRPAPDRVEIKSVIEQVSLVRGTVTLELLDGDLVTTTLTVESI